MRGHPWRDAARPGLPVLAMLPVPCERAVAQTQSHRRELRKNGGKPMLNSAKRPRRDQTIAADRKLWTSKCRQYRVVLSRCRYRRN